MAIKEDEIYKKCVGETENLDPTLAEYFCSMGMSAEIVKHTIRVIQFMMAVMAKLNRSSALTANEIERTITHFENFEKDFDKNVDDAVAEINNLPYRSDPRM